MSPLLDSKIARYFKENRFAFLFFGLIVLYFYSVVIDLLAKDVQHIAIRIAVGMILAYMFIAATLVIGVFGDSLKTVLCLAIPAFVFEILDLAVLNDGRQELLNDVTQVLSHSFGILFIGYIIYKLLMLIFTSQRVTADTIFASLCAYLLLATLWTYSYSLLEMFDPGAFKYSLIDDPEKRIMRLGAEPAGIESYYSLVTMTTLGYGDIIPVTSAARSLATLQAVVGQLYLAVLVARLVGLHVADSVRKYDAEYDSQSKR